MTNESEERDNWSELVENLGVEPVAEENRPQPVIPAPTPSPASERPRKPAPPRPAGDWSQLAGMLGIELPPEEPATEPPPKRVAPPMPASPRAEKPESGPAKPPVAQGFVERTVVEKVEVFETFVPRQAPDEPPQVIDDPVVSLGWSSQQRAEELAGSEPEARLEDLPGYIEPPAMLDDSDTIEEMLSYRDAGQAEMDGDDFASEPAVRRRRRRRGRRRDGESAEGAELGSESEASSQPAPMHGRTESTRAEAESGFESSMDAGRELVSKHRPESDADSDASADADSDADSDSEERSDASAEDTGRAPAVRRRRRRRRRRGGEDRAPTEARTSRRSEGQAADSAAKPIGKSEISEVDDDDVDDSSGDDDDFADGSSADDESSDDTSAGRHRKIPTWAEAVTVVIDANMQSRTKSGGNSRGGDSRGRRRGRR